jgi:hypothetical protein
MEISLEKIPEKTQNNLTLLIYLKIKESKQGSDFNSACPKMTKYNFRVDFRFLPRLYVTRI